MKFVLDTNILISATLWHDSVAQKLLLNLAGAGHQLYSSPEILLEYETVLARDFDYSLEVSRLLAEQLLEKLILVIPKEKISFVKEDADDDKVLECAAAASADFIVTYDKHLLKLGKFRGTGILTPEGFLKNFTSKKHIYFLRAATAFFQS